LISLCFRWLAAGRPASIKGRDIGQGLIAWVKGTRATTIRELERAVTDWHKAEAERLIAKERDTTSVDDKADCLEALISGCVNVEAVIAKIERLFSEGDDRKAILLTSTHRAKGLEADRVWLLRDTYCQRAGTGEENLLYVAITRSKRELIYVRKDGYEIDNSFGDSNDELGNAYKAAQ
jgi:DNA helicase-2/ATP-dependent DNA helicase PcrA